MTEGRRCAILYLLYFVLEVGLTELQDQMSSMRHYYSCKLSKVVINSPRSTRMLPRKRIATCMPRPRVGDPAYVGRIHPLGCHRRL